MKVKTTAAVAATIILAGIVFGPVRRHMCGTSPALEKEYRGVILELPKAQLAWVKKGDYVDVLCALDSVQRAAKTEPAAGKGGNKEERISEIGESRKYRVALTALQNVKVAGVDAREGSIVLLLNPVEAQFAALSRDHGAITLSLRAKGDSNVMPLEVASYRRLLNN